MTRPAQSRSSSAHSVKSNGGRRSAMGMRVDDERQLDFCNAFWNPGGVENLLDRMKGGGKVLNELGKWFDERASIEEDYAKRLHKLSKNTLGSHEIGTLKSAFDHVRTELAHYAQSHLELAKIIKTQLEGGVKGFANRREEVKKAPQQGIEKSYKLKRTQEDLAFKARKKFEDDCITINGLTAQTSLIQGRDLDKVGAKLDKVNQTVQVNEKEYSTHISALKDSTFKWNMDWKSFCDLCQDLEEERVDFVKVVLWDYANAISTVCIADDESCERVRVALENCDTARDIRHFVRQHGTGNAIDDPPPYINFAKGETVPLKPTFSLANFSRSSTHTKVQTSLTAVQDLVAAIRSRPNTPAPPPPEQPTAPIPPSSPAPQPSKPAQPYPINTAPVPIQPPLEERNDMFDDLQTPVANPNPSPPELDRGRSDSVVSRGATIATKATVGTGTPNKANTPMEAIQAAVERGTPQAQPQPQIPKVIPAAAPPMGNHRSQESVASVISVASNASRPDRAASPTPSIVSMTSGVGRSGSKRYTVARASASDIRQAVGAATAGKLEEKPEEDALEQALKKLKDEAGVKPPPGAVALPGMAVRTYKGPGGAKTNGVERASSPSKQPQMAGQHGHPHASTSSFSGPSPTPPLIPNQNGNGNYQSSPAPAVPYQAHPSQQPQPPRAPSPIGISLDAHGQVRTDSYPTLSQQPQLSQPPPQSYPFRPQSQANYLPQMPSYPQFPNPSTPTNGYTSSNMYNQQPQYGQPQHYGQPTYQQPQYQPYAMQQQQAPSPTPAPQRHPPTGNYTDDGRPIMFYVKASYDFTGEESTDLKFSTGDILAVVKTLEDGWWEGQKVGVEGTGMFPSNFVALLE
ncbi:hypothetical protein BT69DRAFT_1316018 [Atractiella rhizophila]|nr:hypothetical protein BT69DRAFT_1322648 [Atractiella rhizophila]KAH8928966.1 hypothetical protein BT69DRAFT_1316018 [Atractiella rhizophila]